MAASSQQVSEDEARAHAFARVTPMSVSAPVGRFLLMRKGAATCAIRFTSFRRDHDAKPPTVFSSGEEHTYAEYDWYFQGDGSGDFSRANVLIGHGKLRTAPAYGLGHMAIRPGKLDVECGSLRYFWAYPNAVAFLEYVSGRDDHEVELAPTKAPDIREVNVRNPSLIWYRIGGQRERRFIPLEQLP